MDNDVQWRHTEVVRGSEKTISTHGIRVSREMLQLTQQQEQASKDIAFACLARSMGAGAFRIGFKTSSYGAGGGHSDDGAYDNARKSLEKMHAWQIYCIVDLGKECYVNAVEALDQDGHTARSFADQIGRHHQTVIDWYRGGLDEYINLFYKKRT